MLQQRLNLVTHTSSGARERGDVVVTRLDGGIVGLLDLADLGDNCFLDEGSAVIIAVATVSAVVAMLGGSPPPFPTLLSHRL